MNEGKCGCEEEGENSPWHILERHITLLTWHPREREAKDRGSISDGHALGQGGSGFKGPTGEGFLGLVSLLVRTLDETRVHCAVFELKQ